MEYDNQDENVLAAEILFGNIKNKYTGNSTGNSTDNNSNKEDGTKTKSDPKVKPTDIFFDYLKKSKSTISDKITERKKAEEELPKYPFGDTLVEKGYQKILGVGSAVKNYTGATKDYTIEEGGKVGRTIGSMIKAAKESTTGYISEKNQPFRDRYNSYKDEHNKKRKEREEESKKNPSFIKRETEGLKRVGGHIAETGSAFKQNIGSYITASKDWISHKRNGANKFGESLHNSTIGKASKAYEQSTFIKPAVGVLGKGARTIGNTAKGIYKFADKAAKVARAFTHTNDIFHTGHALSRIFGEHDGHGGGTIGTIGTRSAGTMSGVGGRDQSASIQGGNISDSIEGSGGGGGGFGGGGTDGSAGMGDKSVYNILSKIYQILSISTNYLGKIDRTTTIISKLIRDNQVIMSSIMANNKARMNEDGSSVTPQQNQGASQSGIIEAIGQSGESVSEAVGESAREIIDKVDERLSGKDSCECAPDNTMDDRDIPDTSKDKKNKSKNKKVRRNRNKSGKEIKRKAGSKSKFGKARSAIKSISEKGAGTVGKVTTVGKGLVKGVGYLGGVVAGVDTASKLAEGDIKGATESGVEAAASVYAPLVYGGIKIASAGIDYAEDKTFGEGGASVINDLHKKGIIDYNFGDSEILKWDEVEKLPDDTIQKMISANEFSEKDVSRLKKIIEKRITKPEVKGKQEKDKSKTLEPTKVPVSPVPTQIVTPTEGTTTPVEAQKVTPTEGTTTPVEAQKATVNPIDKQEVPSTLDKAKTIGKSLLSNSPLVGATTAVNALIPKEKEQLPTGTPVEQTKPEIYTAKYKNKQYEYENAVLSSLFDIPRTNDEDVVRKTQGSIQNNTVTDEKDKDYSPVARDIDSGEITPLKDIKPLDEKYKDYSPVARDIGSGEITPLKDIKPLDIDSEKEKDLNFNDVNIEKLNIKELSIEKLNLEGGASALSQEKQGFFGKAYDKVKETLGFGGEEKTATPQTGASKNAPTGKEPTAEEVEAIKGAKGSKKSESQKAYYDKMYNSIYKAAKEKGVEHPEVIAKLGAAQTSLETGYGKHMVGNNAFGIKAKKGGDAVTASTQEFENGKMVTKNQNFRKYDNPEDSAADYVDFLQHNKRYKDVLAAKTAEEGIAAQAKTGYATDPDYGKKLGSINKSFEGSIAPETKLAANEQKPQLEAKVKDNGTQTYIPYKEPTATLVSENAQKEPLLNQTMKTSTPVREKPSEMAGLESSMNKVGAAVAQSGQTQTVSGGGDQGGNNNQGFGKVPFNVRNDDPLLLTLQYGNLRTV